MKHYKFLFLMADQIRTATLEGMGMASRPLTCAA